MGAAARARREAGLARALKSNLQKRKAQKRGRDDAAPERGAPDPARSPGGKDPSA